MVLFQLNLIKKEEFKLKILKIEIFHMKKNPLFENSGIVSQSDELKEHHNNYEENESDLISLEYRKLALI